MSEEKYQVHACEAEHSIPTFSFLFEEKEKPGTFYPDRANSLGIPKGELWHKLQQEDELTKKSDHVILEKLRAEGYKDLDTQSLFEIFYRDDEIREKIMSEIDRKSTRLNSSHT